MANGNAGLKGAAVLDPSECQVVYIARNSRSMSSGDERISQNIWSEDVEKCPPCLPCKDLSVVPFSCLCQGLLKLPLSGSLDADLGYSS